MTENKINNIETIKKAIEIEIKHNYIDIRGKHYTFSMFILGEIKEFLKEKPKHKKLFYLQSVFKNYPTDSISHRMKSIKQLISYIKNPDEEEIIKKAKRQENKLVKNPEEVDIMYVKGVGPKIALVLNKLDIYSAQDLLNYYPKKHLDYAHKTPIKDLKIGEEVTVFGEITSTSIYQSKKGLTIISINITDETGNLSTSWFYGKSNRFMQQKYKAQYPKGANIIISGTVKLDSYSGKLSIDKPQTEVISGDFESKESLHVARIVPVYPLTENLNVKTLRKAINNAIETYYFKIEEFLPHFIIKQFNLIDRNEAVKQIHFPDSFEDLEKARKRLVFEELFLLQLRLAVSRADYCKNNEGLVLNTKTGGFVDKFINLLPFELTKAQENAFNEILTDMNSNEPMQRLLQGDVGSGKTVVALMALLTAVENGYQGAIMAPTEILAEQHYKTFVQWLTPLGLSIGLFVGKHGVKKRRELNQNLKNGQINIAVGTHALIQEAIEFNNLGIAVVDEQHRFGVKQRSLLKNKGLKGNTPELLTMTATPIPRTLALSAHGDLDLTIIDELPSGRLPIKTAFVRSSGRTKAHRLIKQEVEKGHQAYVIFPLIEESETLSAKAATIEAEKLQTLIFPDLNVGLVHGKMKSKEKDEVMESFRKGEYNILVSTTVVEVGVDVPNATVMVIENAERFGLSQLHQLRGRVGRNTLQSYCVLVADTNSQETRERLEIMTKTNDGFVIAEKDLQIRGPGEFMGTKQSGLPDLVLADLIKDAEVLEEARKTAFEFVKNNNIKDFPLLNRKIKKKIDEGMDFITSG